MAELEGYRTKREVCALIQKTPRTVERWMKLGIIPYIKVGKGRRATVLFKWADIEMSLQRMFGVGRTTTL